MKARRHVDLIELEKRDGPDGQEVKPTEHCGFTGDVRIFDKGGKYGVHW
jgi:hypothetical protein